jgi:4-amino-4-deoxy-L-arabinose transferase-like glycosyltransferase
MSQTLMQEQSTADVQRRGRVTWLVLTLAIVFVLGAVGGFFRLYRLAELPPGLFYDEGAYGLDALGVLNGQHAIFFERNQGREGLIIYTIAALIPFLGRTVEAVRLPTALASVGTIFAVFWLGQVLFGSAAQVNARQFVSRWLVSRGLLVGGAAALMLAVSTGQTIIGRISFRANFLPLLLALAIALLWSGVVKQQRWRIVLAGICTGLLPYTYIPARFVPFILLIFGITLLWPRRRQWDEIKRYVPILSLYVFVTALVAAPILIDFALNPHHFTSRSNNLWVFSPEISHGQPLAALITNIVDHLAVFGFRGDPNWRHNYDVQPWLNPGEAIFFWLGLFFVARHWRTPAYRLLLIWGAVLLLPAILAFDAPPNTLRMMGLTPVIYLITALGLWHLAAWLMDRAGGQARRWVAAGAVTVLLVLVGWRGVYTYDGYFNQWALDPEVYQTHRAEWTNLANEINDTPPDADTSYLIPWGSQFPADWQEFSFDFLYLGTPPAHFFVAAAPDLAQQLQATIQADSPNTVRAVDWTNGVHWSGDATDRLPFLLGKYGAPLAAEDHINYRTLTFGDLRVDRPWALYEWLDPLNVHYDGQIRLEGSAIGYHGGEQRPLTAPLPVRAGDRIWLALSWQAVTTPVADYAISLRLLDAGGGTVQQYDSQIWSFNRTPTSTWQPGEMSESLVNLTLPTDLADGDYTLRLIVYDVATLVPTVQVDVWTPEVDLAQLQVRN